jgi:hypothetical protein
MTTKSQLDAIEQWAAQDREAAAGRRTVQWTEQPDGTLTRPCRGTDVWTRKPCPHNVVKPAVGREPTYCSDSCKMADYRRRKTQRDQQARIDAARHDKEEVAKLAAGCIGLELVQSASVKLSMTQRTALAAQIVRALELADLLQDTPPRRRYR